PAAGGPDSQPQSPARAARSGQRGRAGDRRRRPHAAKGHVMNGLGTPPTSPMADVILSVHHLTKRFEGLVANREIDFEIPRHAIVSMIGPNGAGKTTFFNQLTGIIEPTSGTIEFDGTSLVGLAPHDVAELGIARTYQNIRLFADMTVLANVMVGRHVRMKAQWYEAVLGLPRVRREDEEAQRRALELLDLVNLSRRYSDE